MHDEMETLADLYAAGGLGPDERRAADAHAAQCSRCASILREASDFRGWVTGALAPDAPPADLEDRIVARLRASTALKTRRWRLLPGKRLLKLLGGLAAAVGLVFLGNGFSGTGANPGANPGVTGAQWNSSTSGGGGGAYFPDKDRTVDEFFLEDVGLDLVNRANVTPSKNWSYLSNDFPGTDLRIDGAFGEIHSDRLSFGKSTEWDATDGGRRSQTFHSISKPDPLVATVSDGISLDSKVGKAVLRGIANLESDKANKGKEIEKLSKADADAQDFVRKIEANLSLTSGEERFPKAEPKPEMQKPNPLHVQDNRKIIRTAEVDLEVEAYEATSTRLMAMVTEEKGFVATASTQRLANGKIRATVTVRVPPERFYALIAKLKDLGTVRSQNVGSQEITKAYLDLETRRGSKEALLERLKLLLKEAKGTVKEFLEVEVQMGKTIEEIESIKGELKYYDNQVSLSTLTLTISEKDLGQPFEYVQTLQSNIGLTARNADDVYAKAQKEIVDAGGQVVDSKMNRQNDGSATGTIRGRVDAEKFPALREALKKLGRVTNDTVNQQKTARGGQEGAVKSDAPLKKEQAVVDLTIATPPVAVTRRAQLLIETSAVQSAYPDARKTIEAAGGRIQSGSLQGRGNGTRANVSALVDVEGFDALVKKLKESGKLKDSTVQIDTPAATADGAPPLLREQAQIDLFLVSPPELIGEEHGITKTVKDTLAGSWKGVLWSLEKLFVGLSLAGPWLGLGAIGWLVWRRVRRKKAAPAA